MGGPSPSPVGQRSRRGVGRRCRRACAVAQEFDSSASAPTRSPRRVFHFRKDRWIGVALIVVLTTLVSVGLWKTTVHGSRRSVAVMRPCTAVMGTDCGMAAVVPFEDRTEAKQTLRKAEAVLRSVEARMSTWIARSELGHFNAAAAGREIPLADETIYMLRSSQQMYEQTDGAFDVTCRPLIELWRNAGKRNRAPSVLELQQARASSNWALIELTSHGVTKRRSSARVDLGGIAKGYAIDCALDAIQQSGAKGGLVDVGGDLACFGSPPDGNLWPVDIVHPKRPQQPIELRLAEGAVCTSGNYARFVEIGGRRYSHIVDPRTGEAANWIASATVSAPTAMEADAWATALSVLGPGGFERLPAGIEALVVLDTSTDYRLHCTEGFVELLADPTAEKLHVVKIGGTNESVVIQ